MTSLVAAYVRKYKKLGFEFMTPTKTYITYGKNEKIWKQ